MPTSIVKAGRSDSAGLLDLMRQLYDGEHSPFDSARALAALHQLLDHREVEPRVVDHVAVAGRAEQALTDDEARAERHERDRRQREACEAYIASATRHVIRFRSCAVKPNRR